MNEGLFEPGTLHMKVSALNVMEQRWWWRYQVGSFAASIPSIITIVEGRKNPVEHCFP